MHWRSCSNILPEKKENDKQSKKLTDGPSLENFISGEVQMSHMLEYN